MERREQISKRGKREGHVREMERERLTRLARIRPASLTRLQLLIPATSSAELGTNLKLERRWSYPHCHRHRKAARTPVIKAWKTATQPIFVTVNLAGIRLHHQLGSTTHVTSFHFWPTPSPKTSVLAVNDRQKAHDFGSTIRRHRRAWEVTTGTVGLIEVWIIRSELPVVVDWSPIIVDWQGQFRNFTRLWGKFIIYDNSG